MANIVEKAHFDRFSTVIAASGFQDLKTYTLQDNTVLRLEVTLTARQSDGGTRASFKRVALLYREGGPVALEGPTWQAVDTVKSDPNIDIQYVLGPSSITLRVRNAGAQPTRWAGHVDIIRVN